METLCLGRQLADSRRPNMASIHLQASQVLRPPVRVGSNFFDRTDIYGRGSLKSTLPKRED